MTFAVHEQGSPLRGIPYERAHDAANRAFQSWVSSDCGDGTIPDIQIVSMGSVACDQPEYNNDPPEPNANIVMFRDDDWPYDGVNSVIALTTISFDPHSGEIYDADIELNSYGMSITAEDQNVDIDLQSVLTHEIGHFFGLGHTCRPGDDKCDFANSAMNPSYNPGDIEFRNLSNDDKQGICSIYSGVETGSLSKLCPADTAPAHGFSRYCGTGKTASGCALGPWLPRERSDAWGWLALSVLVLSARRRGAPPSQQVEVNGSSSAG